MEFSEEQHRLLQSFTSTSLEERMKVDKKGKIMAMLLLTRFSSPWWQNSLLGTLTTNEVFVADNDGNNIYHLAVKQAIDGSFPIFVFSFVVNHPSKIPALWAKNKQGRGPFDYHEVEEHLFEVYPPLISVLRLWGKMKRPEETVLQSFSTLSLTSRTKGEEEAPSFEILKNYYLSRFFIPFFYSKGMDAYSSVHAPQLCDLFNFIIVQPFHSQEDIQGLRMLWSWIHPSDYCRLKLDFSTYLNLGEGILTTLIREWPIDFWKLVQSEQFPHYTLIHHFALKVKPMLFFIPASHWQVFDAEGKNPFHYLFRSQEVDFTADLMSDLEMAARLITVDNAWGLTIPDAHGQLPNQSTGKVASELDGYSLFTTLMQELSFRS